MAIILKNMEECDIAHEARLLNEYSEEVEHAKQDTPGSPKAEEDAAQSSPHADAETCATRFSIPLPDDEFDSIELLSFSAFPKCP